jgi:hypothetical protein
MRNNVILYEDRYATNSRDSRRRIVIREREKELTVVIHENTKPNAIHDMDNTHIEAIGRQVISLIMQIQQSIKETDGRQQAN